MNDFVGRSSNGHVERALTNDSRQEAEEPVIVGGPDLEAEFIFAVVLGNGSSTPRSVSNSLAEWKKTETLAIPM
jgi:hypothetical protein